MRGQYQKIDYKQIISPSVIIMHSANDRLAVDPDAGKGQMMGIFPNCPDKLCRLLERFTAT